MKVILILLLGALISFLCELFHRYRKLAWFVLAVLPPLLTPLWLKYPHHTFTWLKIYSIIGIGIAVLAYGIPKVARIERYYLIILAFIALNILEAVVQNCYSGLRLGSPPHIMNALAGVLIIIALPYRNFLSVDNVNGRTFFKCDFHWGIVACYTIWNTLFIYLEWPEFVGVQIMLMLVPLFFMLFDRKLWVEARIYSLAIYLMVHFTWPGFVDGLNLNYTPSSTLGWALAIFSLSSCMLLVWKLKVDSRVSQDNL